MNLLLDTHVLLWWLSGDDRLTARHRDAIAAGANEVHVSAASTWEMSIKAALGKLVVPDRLVESLAEEGFSALPVTVEDGWTAGALPRHHDDPFDRMLIAQAVRRQLRVVTADRRFADYDVQLL